MVAFNFAAWVASASARFTGSADSTAFEEIEVRHFGIHDDQTVAGELHDQSGLLSPDCACSLKSQCALMPAASTTRRSVSSPQRPRA